MQILNTGKFLGKKKDMSQNKNICQGLINLNYLYRYIKTAEIWGEKESTRSYEIKNLIAHERTINRRLLINN